MPGGPTSSAPFGQLGADGGILVRVVQEVHDLSEGLLGFILTGDIGKGLAGLGLGVNLGVDLPKLIMLPPMFFIIFSAAIDRPR